MVSVSEFFDDDLFIYLFGTLMLPLASLGAVSGHITFLNGCIVTCSINI